MQSFVVCFRRKGKCTQRVYDTYEKALKYVERWIGKIKDFSVYPKIYTNADMVKLYLENGDCVKILTPLKFVEKIKK